MPQNQPATTVKRLAWLRIFLARMLTEFWAAAGADVLAGDTGEKAAPQANELAHGISIPIGRNVRNLSGIVI